jgi:ketosteroid isomerase-like protein
MSQSVGGRAEGEMMAHPNEELLRRGYAAFAAGDIETVQALLADGIIWHNGGASLVAGDYTGQQEVLGMLGQIMELTGGTFRLDIHDILANDTHGVVLVTAHAETGGQHRAVREANIWHLADGQATEFWTFAESDAELDRLFG